MAENVNPYSIGGEDKKMVDKFEQAVKEDLTMYLRGEKMIDERVPECPDVEEKWPEIVRAYLPDGAREFQEYPVVSLGWMMFMGMAMAFFWDTDWEKASKAPDLYQQIRDRDGYDNFDDTVLKKVLGLDDERAEKMSELVGRCATRVYSRLSHEHVESGTQAALGCYIAALHQLYLAGMEMELNQLGYHMTPFDPTAIAPESLN